MPTGFDWPTFWLKLQLTLTSRKFWALVAALAATWTAYYNHLITIDLAIQATIAALAAYSISVGVEGINAKPPSAPQP